MGLVKTITKILEDKVFTERQLKSRLKKWNSDEIRFDFGGNASAREETFMRVQH